jgi:hypothetical protein
MSFLRRFEILLPTRFNDGTSIPRRIPGETAAELRERFGAASKETQLIHGEWEYGGVIFRDAVMRIFVDAPRTPASREFFAGYKETLKARFRQIEMWITAFEIEKI